MCSSPSGRGARHDMPGADFGDRADCEHESSVAQRGVDQPVAAPIDGRNASAASSKANVWVARAATSSSSRSQRRLPSSLDRPVRLLIGRDSGYLAGSDGESPAKSAPNGSGTGLLPYQDATRAVPSCANSGRLAASAAGLPLASITTPAPRCPDCDCTVASSSSGETAVTPNRSAVARRQDSGSLPTTRAPSFISSAEVSSPTTRGRAQRSSRP